MRLSLTRLVLTLVAIGGVLVAVLPQHLASIVGLLAGAGVIAAVTIGVVSLTGPISREPVTGSRLDRPPTPAAPPLDPTTLQAARRSLSARGGATTGPLALNDESWRRLVAAAATTCAAHGIDLDDPAARDLLGERVHTALTTSPTPGRTLPASQVAASVDVICDTLDTLGKK